MTLRKQKTRQVDRANLGEVLDARAMQEEQESRKILTPTPQGLRALAGTNAFLLILGQHLLEMRRERVPPISTLLGLDAPPHLKLSQQSQGRQILLETRGHRVGPITGRISPVSLIALDQVN
jgi:hypothetical protein